MRVYRVFSVPYFDINSESLQKTRLGSLEGPESGSQGS